MTKPYADMSHDELSAYVETADASPTSIAEAIDEMERKSAVMTAICKLAAELDEDGWVCVPREATIEMCVTHDKRWSWDDWSAYELYNAMIAAAPPLDHGETA